MRKIFSFLMIFAICLTSFSNVALADSNKIVTLGADLNDEQVSTVLSFFGVDDLNKVQVIEINNSQEREVLGGIVSDALIGTKTYSCAYIEPTESGGINVRTANLTYVSDSTLANALMTAGVKNCNLIVTAPFAVSGTGALTGVYTAYETSGVALDEDKKDVATEELIITSSMQEMYGADINNIIHDVKQELIKTEDMSDDEIRSIIRDTANQYDVALSESDIETILSLLRKIASLDYDLDAFTSEINKAINKLSKVQENLSGIQKFFAKIVSFFSNLFGGKKDSTSIFDKIDTSIFNFDETSVKENE